MDGLRRIVLAIDGSPDADALVEYTADLAESTGAAVLVFHVNPTQLTAELVGEQAAHEHGIETAADAETMVLSVVKLMRERGIECEPQVGDISGDHLTTAEMIVAAADTFDADLIVTGSRGLSAPRRLLMGSVSHAVLQQAHCPVLILGAGVASGEVHHAPVPASR